MQDLKCSICAELNEDDECNLLKKYCPAIESRLIFSTSDFCILPTLGSFVPGYLMIITRDHIASIGHLANDKLDTLERLIACCKKVIQSKFLKRSIVFEHGPVSPTKRGGCCIDHAHVHIVPTDLEIIHQFHSSLSIEKIEKIYEIQSYIRRGIPYIFYENLDSSRFVLEGDIIPSQYVRQVIARNLNLPYGEWDWRHYPFCNNIMETLRIIKVSDFEEALNAKV